jgi:TolB-like protein
MAVIAAGVVIAVAATLVVQGRRTAERPAALVTVANAVNLPERSIAVLHFVSLGKTENSDVLALGIPEAVLHQLATLNNLQVMARTSSFAFRDSKADARIFGQSLNALHLLEGSVQTDRGRLRVTAQLVDVASGGQVWSMQFDKTPDDVFALQDEIALRVARALQISLDAGTTEQLAAHNTANFDAYLEYLQASSLLATWRLADMRAAIGRAAKAIELDPKFAAAYVLLTRAKVRVAELDVTASRPQHMDAALQEGRLLLQQALALNARDSRAYVERGYVTAFHDAVAAEQDYRRALELNPSDAEAYEILAVVLADQPPRRAEALGAIDQARKLDPSEPRLDVIKATMIYYGRGDINGAVELVEAALNRNPLYSPALARLEQLRLAGGHQAEAIYLGEQVIASDPQADQARQILRHAYLDVNELAAAKTVAVVAGTTDASSQSLIGSMSTTFSARPRWFTPLPPAIRYQLLLRLWPLVPFVLPRATTASSRAAAFFTQRGAIKGDESGNLIEGDVSSLQFNAVGLADMLLQMGEAARARQLLEASLVAMDRDEHEYQRGAVWYFLMRPVALALLGRYDEAITVLQNPLFFRPCEYVSMVSIRARTGVCTTAQRPTLRGPACTTASPCAYGTQRLATPAGPGVGSEVRLA